MSTPSTVTTAPTLTAAALNRIISEAALFAGKDPILPMINAVYLEATGDHLVAVATDRFALGASATPYEGEPFDVAIPLEYVPLLISVTAGRRNRWMSVEVGVSPKGKRFKVTTAVDLALSIPTVTRHDKFPNWRELLTRKREATEFTEVMLNPDKLRPFTRLKTSSLRIRTTSPVQPIVITARDDFIGLAMPMRLESEPQWKEPSWLKAK